MSDFQTVKRRGHSQSANSKYPEQHQQLVEMGFDNASVTRALDASNGDMEAATAVLIGESSHKADAEEKIVTATNSKEKKVASTSMAATVASGTPAAADVKAKTSARQPAGLASVSGAAVKEIKDAHQRMMATYKVQKCKETGAHDRKMCMHYHSLSDRRRNPFEILYSCYECPNTVDGGECPDGDSCMHSHTMLERMFHPELYKISVCQRQLTGNKCDRAMLCAFAHNDADLRISPSHLTTKYAMQEEAKTTPVPVNQSVMLDHIRNNLVKLVKEYGSEGIIAADLPKYYQGKFHESLDIIDETGKKYKLKDLIGPHNNIHVVLTGQPRFVFGDPSAANFASETTAAKDVGINAASVPLSVKDRVVELIKTAGPEGILATDMPKKYQEKYNEKLDKDWTVGLNTVAGMVLTQTKQYTKYTFNAITAGLKDTSLNVSGTKDGKSPVAGAGTAAKAGAVAAPPSTTTTTTATAASASGSKWGSSAGKSFASILASNSSVPPSVNPGSVSESLSEPVTPSTSSNTPAVPAVAIDTTVVPPSPISEVKTPTSATAAATAQKTTKAEKSAPTKSSTTSKTDNAKSTETAEKDNHVDHSTPSTSATTTDSLLANGNSSSVVAPASPASSGPVGLTLGSSPSISRSTSDMGSTLPKPLFGGLDSQLGVTGLDHDQFSLSGLGGSGASSLLEFTSSSLAGILPSSFDLPLVDNIDLNGSNVLPPGLSKAIGKPSSSNASLTSILGASLGGNVSGSGLVGLPMASSSVGTPERNISSGTSNTAVNTTNMSPTEKIAYLERELAMKAKEMDAYAVETATLRARVTELEGAQMNHDDRLRSSLLEKDIELLAKHQEVAKLDEEARKLKEEKLVDLDQYFIYFSKIEEVMNSMKCKEEAFSDKVKPEDVQELFQFKKLIRNYVANVKLQLKNKFDVAVAQTHLHRTSSGSATVKESSTVDAVAFGLGLPPSASTGLTSSTSSSNIAGAVGATSASPASATSVFGMLSSGNSASVGNNASGTSRFAASFDNHSVPLHLSSHNHHNVLGNVVDAFASSSVLFPSSSSSTDLSSVAAGNAAGASLNGTKQCGLPGCFKEGLYTCAGCRKISYCGENHQRSHWAQHSLNCYQR